MADTIEQISRRVRAMCPLAPPLLTLEWIQEAYNKISDARPWSHLRGQGQLTVNDARSGTCNVTLGSATVQGVGLVFVAADAGRQFRVSSGIPFTILSVDLGLNTCLLDEPYGSSTALATTGQILDAYMTMPEDFGRFVAVLDPPNNRQLHIFITDEELNFYDPKRMITGLPRALASRRFSTYSATTGQVQYELVPYALTSRVYPYFYIKRPGKLSFDDQLLGVLRHRPDLLVKGAILECCKWPGLDQQQVNPYSKISDARVNLMVSEFEREEAKLEARDEEIYMTWLETIGLQQYPFYAHPFVSADIRASDIDFPSSRYW